MRHRQRLSGGGLVLWATRAQRRAGAVGHRAPPPTPLIGGELVVRGALMGHMDAGCDPGERCRCQRGRSRGCAGCEPAGWPLSPRCVPDCWRCPALAKTPQPGLPGALLMGAAAAPLRLPELPPSQPAQPSQARGRRSTHLPIPPTHPPLPTSAACCPSQRVGRREDHSTAQKCAAATRFRAHVWCGGVPGAAGRDARAPGRSLWGSRTGQLHTGRQKRAQKAAGPRLGRSEYDTAPLLAQRVTFSPFWKLCFAACADAASAKSASRGSLHFILQPCCQAPPRWLISPQTAILFGVRVGPDNRGEAGSCRGVHLRTAQSKRASDRASRVDQAGRHCIPGLQELERGI